MATGRFAPISFYPSLRIALRHNTLQTCRIRLPCLRVAAALKIFLSTRKYKIMTASCFRVSSHPVSAIEVQKMSAFLQNWVKLYVNCLGGRIESIVLKRKIAQSVCLSVMRYYPKNWSTLFDEFISLFSEVNGRLELKGINALVAQQMCPPLSESNPILLNLLDVFLEVLQELDSMVFNRNLNLTNEQFIRTSEIKDSMRITCLPSIVEMLALILVHSYILINSFLLPLVYCCFF